MMAALALLSTDKPVSENLMGNWTQTLPTGQKIKRVNVIIFFFLSELGSKTVQTSDFFRKVNGKLHWDYVRIQKKDCFFIKVFGPNCSVQGCICSV